MSSRPPRPGGHAPTLRPTDVTTPKAAEPRILEAVSRDGRLTRIGHEAAVPWLAWAALGAYLGAFTETHHLALPLLDENLVALESARGWDLGWLLAPHHGHRVPLPKLALVGLYELGGPRAMRHASWAAPWLGAAVALDLARRLRGRPAWIDVAFPLMLGGAALAFSAVHAFDLHFGLQALLALAAAWCLGAGRSGLAFAACAACLLCGVNGLCLGLALGAVFVLGPARREGLAAAAVLGVAAPFLFSAAPADARLPTDPSHALRSLAGLAASPLSADVEPWALAGAAAFAIAFAVTVMRPDGGRGGAPAVAWAGLAGGLLLWLAIAVGRPPPVAHLVALRYRPLVAQAYVFALLVLAARQRNAPGARVPAALLALSLAAATPHHLAQASELGAAMDRLQRDTRVAIDSGWTPEELATHYGDDLYPCDRGTLVRALRAHLDR